MFTIFTKKSKGFTLIEIILAVGISLIVVMVLVWVSVYGLKKVRDIRQEERLQAEADYLVNKLAYWTRQGKQLDVVSPSELRITLPDSSTKTFIKSGDKINLDGQQLVSGETKVTNLVFTSKDYSVKIDLSLNRGSSNLSVKTTLAQRN